MSYARVTTIVQDASVSDYSDAQTDTYTDSLSSARIEKYQASIAAAATRALDFGGFTTVSAVVINNASTSGSVTVGVTNAASAAVSQSVAAGKTLKLTDIKQSENMTIAGVTATQTVEVIIIGS